MDKPDYTSIINKLEADKVAWNTATKIVESTNDIVILRPRKDENGHTTFIPVNTKEFVDVEVPVSDDEKVEAVTKIDAVINKLKNGSFVDIYDSKEVPVLPKRVRGLTANRP